jgi:hypothetical protein
MKPLLLSDLFEQLDKLLIESLRSCTTEDWKRPTLARKWTVKDVAAHLLDGNLRTLSMGRDSFFGETPPPIDSYQDLVGWLNQLNGNWVNAFTRVSPEVLTDLLASTGTLVSNYYRQLDPFSPALFAVAWAGEESSLNWFHIAREYTEKWHHQAQIREALGTLQPLLEPTFYLPFLETLMRGLPYQYRNQNAETGSSIRISIPQLPTANWFLLKEDAHWKLYKEMNTIAAAIVEIQAAFAWQLFTKAIRPEELLNKYPEAVLIQGNRELAETALHLVAVMA